MVGGRVWWANIGGVTIDIKVDRDGRPTSIRVTGPGIDNGPEPGCEWDDDIPAGEPDSGPEQGKLDPMGSDH